MSSLVVAMQWLPTVGTSPPGGDCLSLKLQLPGTARRVRVKSQSYFTTGGLQPISLFWHQAPWSKQPEFPPPPQLNPCGHSPYVTSSLTRRWVCLSWIGLAFLSSVCIAHTACYWKFLLLHYIHTYKSSISPGFAKQIMPILCYNNSLTTLTVVSLNTAKFKPLIFSTSGLSYTATCSFSWFCMTSACYLHNFVT
jgi:hypothetical protein